MDEPERPDIPRRDGQDVGVGGEGGGVAVFDVFKGGVIPVHFHGGAVDRPEDTGDGVVDLYVCVERVAGSRRKGGDGRGARHDGRVGEGILASAAGRCGASGGGVGVGRAGIGEDGGRARVDGAAAAAVEGGVEPVVADGLIGVDDDVVALADAHVQAGDGDGLDWDHVCGDDGEGVADQGYRVAVLHRAVDQPEEMALAGRESDLLVAS